MKLFYLRLALLILAVIVLPLMSYTQQSNFRFDKITSENIKIEKGLSVNTVHCILQDDKGYMWFGTWDGLNKFDGYKFTVYKANELEGNNELCNQTVRSLYKDKNGNIWIGTEGGLNKLDIRTKKFFQYKHNVIDKYSLSNDTVRVIFEDSFGILWIGTQNGLNVFDKQTGNFFQFYSNPTDNNSLSNNTITDIIQDRSGYIWFATQKGLNKLDFPNKKVTHFFYNNQNKNSICNDTINSIIESKNGDIWIGTANGLCKYENQKFTCYKQESKNSNSITSNKISKIFQDSKGLFWIGTSDKGLITYDEVNNTFGKYENSLDDVNSISSNSISYIMEDRSGIIWVATEKGVNKIDKNSNKFRHYQHIENIENSLSNNSVWDFYEDDDNNIFICTDGGLNVYNRKTGKIKKLKNSSANGNIKSESKISAVIKDEDGYIWIGTGDAGVKVLQMNGSENYSEVDLFKDFNYKIDKTIWCLHQDKNKNIWIATNNGLYRFNKKNNELKSFKYYSYNPYSISSNIIYYIYEDTEGVLWFCTYNGLDRYYKKNDKFYAYKHIPNNSQSPSTNTIYSIFEDKNGIMWIGTFGGGLNRFDKTTGTFKYYTEKDGLANNVVYGVLEDNNSNLWISTNSGISKFNKTETFVNYDVKDGVQSSEFNGNAFLKTKDGEFYFGGMNGFNAFYPNEIKRNKFIPPIVITSFKIFNEIQKSEIQDGNTITLSHNDNFFSFEFSALDYSNPIKNRYKYKLENFDKGWIFCDANRRFAEYTKVNPGTYKLLIRGTNSDGVWNDKGISITIIVNPPWWATWTFRILFIISVIAITWYILGRRFQQIRKKHEIEKKVIEIEKQLFELEQKSLRLQMNPHFIFNSLNSIQSFIINNDSDKATLYLAKFAQLMRLILANSRESYVPVKDELKSLKYYMDIENLRFDNKFDYNINIDPEVDDDFIGIPPMIIQPYVENAILHGIVNKQGRGKISINLSLKDDYIFCIIEDDGVGRAKAENIKSMSGLHHKSSGMIITRERLEIINKQLKGKILLNVIDLMNENNEAIGTRVEIFIPFIEM
ncbi:MAG TPA: two-component regulator propeller domain-containing protein [Bacteroidales bacterium]|nr:two-component regulator propeller domain-containing protein [Bacteroidales bacterium]HPS15827.1 two-component regulator propeller domain-containing protein [Bacteroidales bacterium]